MELKLGELSQHWFHTQISSVHNLLLRHFGIDPLASTPLWKRPLRALLDHVLVLWCGLHSDHSSAIALTIHSDGAACMPLVRLAAIRNPATAHYVGHLQKALSRLLRRA